ncbi:hypothetical protein ADUPG1_006821 [Aduncisulcus paluster]|uniref:Cyclin N-terminal domain-containing protein n=1 Tax=Aduncisulcus paluster TaxID=2918883 RepID=A0ABQ5KMJ4_9EUKA|nr:hypothetical protein ADUPG1_006821 [Aduncisulcus paluster]
MDSISREKKQTRRKGHKKSRRAKFRQQGIQLVSSALNSYIFQCGIKKERTEREKALIHNIIQFSHGSSSIFPSLPIHYISTSSKHSTNPLTKLSLQFEVSKADLANAESRSTPFPHEIISALDVHSDDSEEDIEDEEEITFSEDSSSTSTSSFSISEAVAAHILSIHPSMLVGEKKVCFVSGWADSEESSDDSSTSSTSSTKESKESISVSDTNSDSDQYGGKRSSISSSHSSDYNEVSSQSSSETIHRDTFLSQFLFKFDKKRRKKSWISDALSWVTQKVSRLWNIRRKGKNRDTSEKHHSSLSGERAGRPEGVTPERVASLSTSSSIQIGAIIKNSTIGLNSPYVVPRSDTPKIGDILHLHSQVSIIIPSTQPQSLSQVVSPVPSSGTIGLNSPYVVPRSDTPKIGDILHLHSQVSIIIPSTQPQSLSQVVSPVPSSGLAFTLILPRFLSPEVSNFSSSSLPTQFVETALLNAFFTVPRAGLRLSSEGSLAQPSKSRILSHPSSAAFSSLFPIFTSVASISSSVHSDDIQYPGDMQYQGDDDDYIGHVDEIGGIVQPQMRMISRVDSASYVGPYGRVSPTSIPVIGELQTPMSTHSYKNLFSPTLDDVFITGEISVRVTLCGGVVLTTNNSEESDMQRQEKLVRSLFPISPSLSLDRVYDTKVMLAKLVLIPGVKPPTSPSSSPSVSDLDLSSAGSTGEPHHHFGRGGGRERDEDEEDGFKRGTSMLSSSDSTLSSLGIIKKGAVRSHLFPLRALAIASLYFDRLCRSGVVTNDRTRVVMCACLSIALKIECYEYKSILKVGCSKLGTNYRTVLKQELPILFFFNWKLYPPREVVWKEANLLLDIVGYDH